MATVELVFANNQWIICDNYVHQKIPEIAVSRVSVETFLACFIR